MRDWLALTVELARARSNWEGQFRRVISVVVGPRVQSPHSRGARAMFC